MHRNRARACAGVWSYDDPRMLPQRAVSWVVADHLLTVLPTKVGGCKRVESRALNGEVTGAKLENRIGVKIEGALEIICGI